MNRPVATTGIVCGVVLQQDGKFLLVQEKKPSAYGQWNLPAGRVDEGETLEQAAVREAKEETGFDVWLGAELLVVHPATEMPVLHAFAADIIGGSLEFPRDELLDAQWFSLEQIVAMKDELRVSEWIIGAIESL